MKFDFERLKDHKKYDVFYNLIQKMQDTDDCKVFLKNAEEILTHIMGMFIDNSADVKRDIERLNQQEKLSDKTLKEFRNVYNEIKNIKRNESLNSKQKDGILNGLNILCNWLLYRESISYMVPLKNNVKGSIALTSLRDRSDTTKKKNANNKEAIVDNIAPLVEEDLEYEKALKERAKNSVHRLFEIKYGIKEENFKSHEEFLQALYKLQDEAFDNYMKFLVSHMTGMRFYVSAQAYKRTCVNNWIKEHGYHNYEEMIKESIEEFRLADKEYEEQREWDLLEELYGGEDDDEDWRDYYEPDY